MSNKTKKTIKQNDSPAVLVTGVGGFNGSTAVDYLIDKGFSVVATDLENANFSYVEKHLQKIKQTPKQYQGIYLNIIPADITKKETLSALFKKRKIKYIFHPAALFNMSAPWQDLYNINVTGTKNLLETALDASEIPEAVIVWSTAAVYGKPVVKGAVSENHPKKPLSLYGRSKWEQELMAMSYVEKGLKVAVLRPTIVYGPRSRYGLAKGFLPMSWSFLFSILPIPGSGKYATSYVHVDDIVGAALHLAEKMNSKKYNICGESFNIADDRFGTIEESMIKVAQELRVQPPFLHMPEFFIRTLGMLMSYGVKLPIYQMEKEEIPYIFLDNIFNNQKLKDTGYCFKYPNPEIGMKVTLHWYAKNNALPNIWYLTHPNWKSYWKNLSDAPKLIADY